MVSTRFSILLVTVTSTLALHGQANATNCDADNYSKVAAAVQTLHANCASWAAYLSSGGVWTCDSTCHDAVSDLVDTLPDCTFGGPYGQNYKEVVQGMVETCGGKVASTSDSTTSPSSVTASPSTTTTTPSTSTAAPTASSNSNDGNSSDTVSTTDAPTATTSIPTASTGGDKNDKTEVSAGASASASAAAGDTPASDVSTTSGASIQAISSITALAMIVAGVLLC
ncbi:hypothetical protein F443_13245 [Phytophthora nicotianae P1569]|uniref:Elicitin n=1 Tax=Phytophthora nicotianae P1569 TaxID=1317065 RepID=V9ETX1_PHYNI|nr:hypothetical protein F443_13245 [Phytophthora nicotianae P1569]